jgi:type I restriction enzyme M protein
LGVTLSTFESDLWEYTNNLLDPVDAAGFKTHIFQMPFFKRICDAWDKDLFEKAYSHIK